MEETQFLSIFESKGLPNLKVKFNAFGCEVFVSLNIEKKMIKHLSANNVYKGDKMYLYGYRKQLTEVNYKSVLGAYEELLNKLQIRLREAKQKVLEDEINRLKINRK